MKRLKWLVALMLLSGCVSHNQSDEILRRMDEAAIRDLERTQRELEKARDDMDRRIMDAKLGNSR